MQRNRLTDQAIANIKAAKSAQLEQVKGGWMVSLYGSKAEKKLTDRLDRPVVYSSKDAARRTIVRHNESIGLSIKPQL